MREQINIVGCGKLGRTLARLWTQHGSLAIQDILNRRPEHSKSALEFIGAGRAVNQFADLQPAQYTLIGAGDDQINGCCEQLAATGVLRPGDIVFHCSGALPASALIAARARGALIASAHPLASFADPAQLAHRFAGTWCTLEGDEAALATLERQFANIGALTQAPYYAVRLYPGDIGASTGLATDAAARVLGEHEQPVDGLYAVGNDMHSIMGGVYTAPGITIGPGMVFAYLAAQHAVARVRAQT